MIFSTQLFKKFTIIKREFNSKLVQKKTAKRSKKQSTQMKAVNFFNTQVILIDSFYRKDHNYHPQVFQKNIDFIATERKMSNINPDIENYSDEDIYSYIEQSDDFDEEYSN